MVLFSWLFNNQFLDYIVSGVTLVSFSLLGAIYIFQTKLIYVPQIPPGSRKNVWRPPQFGFLHYEEVTLHTLDHVKLHAFWIPSSQKNSKEVPTILYFHANAGNMGHRLPIAGRIADMVHCNFFLISYRGYGESEGSPDEVGMRKDAQAALDYLLKERVEDINVNKIVVFGQSIGGAVSIDLVARNQSKIAALIVENTFLSLPKLIPHVMPILGWARGLCHQKWDSETRLKEIKGSDIPKILFLSGSKDELIPPWHMQSLYSMVKDIGVCRFEKFVKGTHNDTCLQPGYYEIMAEFLNNI